MELRECHAFSEINGILVSVLQYYIRRNDVVAVKYLLNRGLCPYSKSDLGIPLDLVMDSQVNEKIRKMVITAAIYHCVHGCLNEKEEEGCREIERLIGIGGNINEKMGEYGRDIWE